jgi:putative transposase
MKNELVYQRQFATRQQAKRKITQYIELFWNHQRHQARLGYLSPAAFMQQYRQQSGTA